MEIFFCDNTERAIVEAQAKGYREDVIVYENGKKYKIAVYSMDRLYDDFTLEMMQYGYFQIPTNLIIVEEVTLDEIQKTIHKLQQCKFFEKIKDEGTMD